MTAPYLRAPKAEDWLAARNAAGLNVVEAATILGVDPSTWRGWERGRHSGPRFGLEYFQLRAARRRNREPKPEVSMSPA